MYMYMSYVVRLSTERDDVLVYWLHTFDTLVRRGVSISGEGRACLAWNTWQTGKARSLSIS